MVAAGQDAAGYEDPGYLGSRDGHIEPVQGVADQHGIDGRVRQRDRLGATRQGADIRQGAAQFGQHRGVGLDRDDVGAQRGHHGR